MSIYPQRSLRQLYSSEKGTAAVEFAIVSPVFILIMVGMLAYGIYFGAVHSVQQLAADAARASIAGISNDERRQLAEAFVSRNVSKYILLRPELVGLSVAPSIEDNSQFDVSVSYSAKDLPIWDLYVPLPTPEKTITRTSTIRLGGV
ncbi:TadE/TadG family type IV pilus assembly protein [Tepidamorphus sp. 3E244]|uniref:TadE/TadG family type IV pilus assembly protein n=1 Tax=Tepidamorphus sp. 3E244 TaxID=3385498 RepID=UPI0038FC0438